LADTGSTVTLVTGASSGIGMEIARLAAQEGENLLLVARRQERLEELGRELEHDHGVSVWVLAKDLSDSDAAQEIADYVEEQGLAVGTLVNNAGIGGHGLFHEQELSRNMKMIQLNVSSLVALTRLLLPGMISRGSGRILNVASTAGFLPGPLQSIYYATKAFVISFSQSIDEELRGKGISSTVLCPGPVRTEFAQTADLEGAQLMRFAATPTKVARRGWKAMKRRKLVVSESGALLFILRFFIPLFPRRVTLKMSRLAMQK
jgi:hypothetical protein